MIIDHDFAHKNKLTLRTLKNPLPVKNVDGSHNKSGPIKHTTIQTIRIHSANGNYHEERSEFYVTSISTHDVILGTDWLKAHNPELDWTNSKLAFTRCPNTCTLSTNKLVVQSPPTTSPAMYISRLEPGSPTSNDYSFETHAANYFLAQHQIHKYRQPTHLRAKTTHSTTLANKLPQDNHDKLNLVPQEFHAYKQVFSETASHRLPAHKPWDHAINLKPHAQMKTQPVYKLTPAEEDATREYIKEHLDKGYIRPSNSPFACPLFFVAKKGNGLRPVQNYQALNDLTIKDATPLPLIPELIDKLQGSRYFTKFDVRWGYNNIRIKEGDEWKAAFRCKLGLFEPLVMTFGLCNAPATFQAYMNKIFADLVEKDHLVVYLDDILIFHHDLNELRRLTHDVLSRLQKHDLYLKPEKCFFNRTSIEYLGVIVSQGQVKMDPAKLSGISDWPTPAKLKDVQAFLGFCNFYRRFIHHFSDIAKPLHALARKDTPFHWSHPEEKAFRTLIQAFTSAPVLSLPDRKLPFRLITDASDYALGAILEQPDALNTWHPVAYYSKSMQPAELNYDIHDKELLAIIRALEHFRHYLEGHPEPFEIWTDHNNLAYFRTKQRISRRQARWALLLSRYNFTIIHKPGAYNKADALSRRTDHKEGMPPADETRVLLTSKFFSIRATRPTPVEPNTPSIRQRIKLAQNYDSEVSTALETILHSGPRSLTKGIEEWNLEDGIILYRGHIYIPKDNNLRRDIVKMYHDHPAVGHPGRWKTYELISREYWWPGLSQFTKNYVDGCATCQATKNKPRTQIPLKPNPVPADIWKAITMDFVTDLPESRNADSMFVVVDRFSKAIVITPCRKTITAEETAQLYLDNVWRRTGLPHTVISDRGPQFASKLMQETWKKLNVNQALSTAFHPQTDGETERVNQEIEQFLRVFCNYQQDNWAHLLPFAEFAHNIRSHSATGRSPFQIWYGFQPDFLPPTFSNSQMPLVEDRLQMLDRLRTEVSAALQVASEVMKRKGPSNPSHTFTPGQLVWLEGTNVKTTHPKAKLAPRRHGPFKILSTTPTNSKLQLPPTWRIHPMFHNSLLTPYTETTEHGPNYTRPPPTIVEGETDHYEVETVVDARPTPNRRGIKYLVKWKGYPESENSWVPASGMKSAADLVKTFHQRHPQAPKPPRA